MCTGGGFYHMFRVSWVQRNVKTRSWVRSVTGNNRKQAPISGDALFNIKHMTSELAKVSIFCHFQKNIHSQQFVKAKKFTPKGLITCP